jgi:hypothetical protein
MCCSEFTGREMNIGTRPPAAGIRPGDRIFSPSFSE